LCPAATIYVFLCEPTRHLKFLNQNERQFKLRYEMRTIYTAGWSRVCMRQAWGKTWVWGQLPPSAPPT